MIKRWTDFDTPIPGYMPNNVKRRHKGGQMGNMGYPQFDQWEGESTKMYWERVRADSKRRNEVVFYVSEKTSSPSKRKAQKHQAKPKKKKSKTKHPNDEGGAVG